MTLCAGCIIAATAQNLSSLPEAQRDSLLISVAKEAILKLGPDYYRENQKPVISYHQNPTADIIGDERLASHAERYYYFVIFPYDPAEEKLAYDFSAKVRIWDDTGDLESVTFGCGWGKGGYDIMGIDWRNDMSITPVPYLEYQVSPVYPLIQFFEPEDPPRSQESKDNYIRKGAEYYPNQPVVFVPDSLYGKPEQILEFRKKVIAQSREVPLNLDELLRRGYERQSDGTWVKTRPDVPPHKRNQ